jgi:hypothetical protein
VATKSMPHGSRMKRAECIAECAQSLPAADGPLLPASAVPCLATWPVLMAHCPPVILSLPGPNPHPSVLNHRLATWHVELVPPSGGTAHHEHPDTSATLQHK